jgi:hypothetical protein
MKHIFLFIIIVIFSSCNRNNDSEKTPISEQEVNDRLMNANKNRVQKESQEIEEFIRQRQFTTERTGTGLRIQIYKRAKNGSPAESSDLCKVFLPDGTLCYETDN